MRTRVVVSGGAITSLALLSSAAPAFAQEAEGDFINDAAEECYHLLAEGNPVERCQKAPNPILPAMNELVLGSLVFLILLAVMWKFAFPMVTKAMEDRTQKIRDNLDEAERTKNDAQ